jgi:cobalt-zinc-cadmium efflux system outer membrane protein
MRRGPGTANYRRRGAASLYEQSPHARALAARINVAKAEARLGTQIPNPSVGVSREDAGGSTDQFFAAEQSLPVSGRLRLLRRAGDAAGLGVREQTRHDLLLLRGDVRIAFYSLLAAQERERVLSEHVLALNEVLRIIRERELAGEGSGYDVLRADRELSEVRSELAEAQVAALAPQAQLASLLGLRDSAQLQATGSLETRTETPVLEVVLARALQSRGDLAGQQQQLARFDFERRAAERQKIPEPVVGAGVKRVTSSGFADSGYVASVTIPLPLFNRGQAESARAHALHERTQSEIGALQSQLEAEVRASYATLQLRRKSAAEYAAKLAASGPELSQTAKLSYEEGERGIFELLDAMRVEQTSRTRMIDLQLAAKLAEIELDRAVGEEILP